MKTKISQEKKMAREREIQSKIKDHLSLLCTTAQHEENNA
jgi:hypothetical protein